jgi:hypothetical protein
MNCEGHYTTKKYIAGQILVFLFSMFKNFARHIPAWDIPGLSLNERWPRFISWGDTLLKSAFFG